MAVTAAKYTVNGEGMGMMELILTAAIIGVVFWLFRWWRSRRNTPRYQGLAERYEGTYTPKAQVRAERFEGTDWGTPPRGMFEVEDYLTGSHQGYRFYCFGWVYEYRASPIDVASDQTPVSRSVYAMELPGHFGNFSVRQHSAARRMFGQNDVQVGHPEFDERFTVRAEDPAAAQQVLRGALLDFLLHDPRSKDFALWFLGDRLICSYKGRFNPGDAEPVLDYLAQVIGYMGYTAPRTEGRNALDEDVVPVRG